MDPKIIIHGGFFSESGTNDEIKSAKQEALKDIVMKAHGFLMGHNALDTVVYAVSLLEDCELFNAGTGSQIQSDGKIRLSAGLMDGVSGKFSGVINVEDIKNPIQVAKTLMEFDDRVLSGVGAQDFARQNDFPYYNPVVPQRLKEYQEKLDSSIGLGTVGCVALDSRGKLAAGTSTGGKGFEIPGRVSDSATAAGNFVNKHAGISCTGVGEDIVSAGLATKIVTRVTDGLSLEEATKRSFSELQEYGGFAGVIGLTSRGELFHFDSHPYMVWAAFDSELSVFA